jgi:hypothetical protein
MQINQTIVRTEEKNNIQKRQICNPLANMNNLSKIPKSIESSSTPGTHFLEWCDAVNQKLDNIEVYF